MGGDAMLKAKAHEEKFYHFCSRGGGVTAVNLCTAEQNQLK